MSERSEKQKKIAIKWSKDAITLCVHNCFANLNQEQQNEMLNNFELVVMSMKQDEWDAFIIENDYSNVKCLARITGLIEQYRKYIGNGSQL